MNRKSIFLSVIYIFLIIQSAVITLAWDGESDFSAMSRENITDIANEMIDSIWSPNADMNNWAYDGIYYLWEANYPYSGEAYCQNNPQENWAEFYSEVNSTEGGTTYFGNDCSGFVSISWRLMKRLTTVGFEASLDGTYMYALGSTGKAQDVSLLQGDALNWAGEHIILFNYYTTSGGIVSMEQTPPAATRREWFWSALSSYKPIRRNLVEGGFSIGDRVNTSADVNIRSCASTACSINAIKLHGSLGTIIDGPKDADQFRWWKVRYDDDLAEGWSSEGYLKESQCTYSITPTSQSFTTDGGENSVSISCPTGCTWTATSNADWIDIPPLYSQGNGNGIVYYGVNANPGTSSRTGTMTIAGHTFTVTQSGMTCTYSISPTSQSFDSNGGNDSVNVSAPNGCAWSAKSEASWISITSGSSGSGNGTVAYKVDENTGADTRTGTMSISGQKFTVTQLGVSVACSYSINPQSQFFDSNGGNDSVNVSAPNGCAWSAKSEASWISITSGSSGSGNGTVAYKVNENTGADTRTGTMSISGQKFTVQQSDINSSMVILTINAGIGGTTNPLPGTYSYFANGSSLNISAIPDKGYEFSGWSGNCSGEGVCTVKMDSNKTVTVTANFTKLDYGDYVLIAA